MIWALTARDLLRSFNLGPMNWMKKQNMAWFIVAAGISLPLKLSIRQFDLIIIFWLIFIFVFPILERALVLGFWKKKDDLFQENGIKEENYP